MSYDLTPYQSEPRLRRRSRSRGRGNGSRHSQKSSRDSGFSEDHDLDPNYISLMVTVFRNGDEFDKGCRISVTRKNFKHWLVLLDHIADRIKFDEPVNRLYTTSGTEVKGFRDLEDNGQYVAVGNSRFKRVRYGRDKKDFRISRMKTNKGFSPLDSKESVDIFLKRQGYQSKTGRPIFDDYVRDSEGSDFDLRNEYEHMALERAKERGKRRVPKDSFDRRGGTRDRYGGSYDRVRSRNHSKSDRFYDNARKSRGRSLSPYY